MLSYTTIKKSEITSATIYLCSDAVVRVRIKDLVELNPTHLKELFEEYNKIIEGKKYPFIYLTENDALIIDKETRTFFRASENSFPKTCIAIVANSLSLKLMANFYLKFHKPTTKIKIFNTEIDATSWCYQEYKKQK